MAYRPSNLPTELTPETLATWIVGELEQITRDQAETTELELRPIHAEPSKPREGMIVYADGANWNPGSGRGVYVRGAAGWEKL